MLLDDDAEWYDDDNRGVVDDCTGTGGYGDFDPIIIIGDRRILGVGVLIYIATFGSVSVKDATERNIIRGDAPVIDNDDGGNGGGPNDDDNEAEEDTLGGGGIPRCCCCCCCCRLLVLLRR